MEYNHSRSCAIIFIEYLKKSDMKRETSINILYKVKDVMERLNKLVGFNCIGSLVSDSCNVMIDIHKKLV